MKMIAIGAMSDGFIERLLLDITPQRGILLRRGGVQAFNLLQSGESPATVLRGAAAGMIPFNFSSPGADDFFLRRLRRQFYLSSYICC